MQKEAVFHEDLLSALDIAKKIAIGNKNAEYGSPHLLKAILHRDFSLLKELEAMKKDVFFIEEWAEVRMDDWPKASRVYQPNPDGSIDDVIKEADEIREILGREEIDLYSIMIALSTPGVGFSFDQMRSFPINRDELLSEVENEVRTMPEEQQTTGRAPLAIKYLYKYCKDKLAISRKKPKEVVAREKEIKEIVEIISRFSKPNVLLQGYPGVGKSVLIEGFVNLIVKKQVPDKIAKTKVYELDLGTLIAGASYKGEIEDRLKKILQELKTFPQAILIIDGIHVLLDKNSDNAGISSILKSELSSSTGLTLIVTTTVDEYTKKIEKDEGLSGMFEVLKIEEPDEGQAFRIIKSALSSYLKHHEIQVKDDSITESIRLSKRYLKEKSLPESALNLLDRSMSVIKTEGISFLKEKEQLVRKLKEIKEATEEEQELELKWFWNDLKRKSEFLLAKEKDLQEDFQDLSREESYIYLENLLERLTEVANNKKEHIEPIDLAAVVAQKTGIPVGKLHSEEKDRLQNMEDTLKRRVVGQDYAIQVITDAVLESRSGLSKAGQPMGSFFFLGPTGTGKTELAKSLADFLFQDEQAIIRFDMSEFKEEHSAALLYGAPPGYVGYEEGGLLVNKIRQKPYSIVLFDEIEKAHSSVFDVFLQIMDEGKLHDRLGKEGDFSNALILFTSNIGSNFIIDSFNEGKGLPNSNQLMEIMGRQFRPEFLGRLTEIIPFAPITKENAMGIFEIHLKKELLELVKGLNINLKVSEEAKSYLVENGFNATYGARPLKGIIRSELRRPMAKKIISEEIKEKDNVQVELENGELKWIVN